MCICILYRICACTVDSVDIQVCMCISVCVCVWACVGVGGCVCEWVGACGHVWVWV